jgi:hypothetical protein
MLLQNYAEEEGVEASTNSVQEVSADEPEKSGNYL